MLIQKRFNKNRYFSYGWQKLIEQKNIGRSSKEVEQQGVGGGTNLLKT